MSDTKPQPKQPPGPPDTSVRLKKAGLTATHPRRLILELLQRNLDVHFSAEEVYRRLLDAGESVGIASVYRVLNQFESAGLVSRHQFDGTTSYFELNLGKHHDHLICTECGNILEFVDEEIEELQRKVAERLGFEIDNHALYLFGRCNNPKCRHRE